jgi:hypothetical protein
MALLRSGGQLNLATFVARCSVCRGPLPSMRHPELKLLVLDIFILYYSMLYFTYFFLFFHNKNG